MCWFFVVIELQNFAGSFFIGGRMSTVVLDVMGADLGLETVVKGACQLSLEKETKIILVGDAEHIQKVLDRTEHDHERLFIEGAEEVISMEDDPRISRPKSSLYKAASLVAQGRGDALVSAGNTGAVVVASSRLFQRLEGVDKVALAAVYPTRKTHGPKNDPFALLLDVGATLHVKAKDLLCFALMGSVYAKIISENPHPKVALLSNGAEPQKGAPEVVEAHQLLIQQDSIFFAGNVEGIDIPKGTVDVVVCEGFLGNVVLKMIEGVGEAAATMIRASQKDTEPSELLLYKQVSRFVELTDWREYGGAPILGLEHVVIKAHGRSTSRAIRNAIKLASRASNRGMVEKIRDGMKRVLS